MTNLYQNLSAKYGWIVDDNILSNMRTKNEEEITLLEKKLEDTIKNAGDLEVIDVISSKGRFYARLGDWSKANELFDSILAKDKDKAGSGRKIDAQLDKAKIALFKADIVAFKSTLSEVSKLVEKGGDWDRRNKLKVYESIYAMMTRDIPKASSLLFDCIATFSSTEICSYGSVIFYATLTNLLTLPRNLLKKNIIDNAHVISALTEAPKLRALVENLHACNYKQFLVSLLALESEVLADRYLGPHCAFLMREFRILAFKQFLEAYKSVLLSSMAASFGIPTSLLDSELSHFIGAGRLGAKIDKVGDIVETVATGTGRGQGTGKEAQYQEVVRKGDVLLNSIQKLVRVIDQ